MKLACSPASIADMKTMTPTPMAMPPMMKRVCRRPSRRKRTAVIHSNGSQRFMAGSRQHGPQALAGQDARALRDREIAGDEPFGDFDMAVAAQAGLHRPLAGAAVPDAEHPG